MDRFFDLHVMSPMQTAVGGALSGDDAKRKDALAFAQEKLEMAYAWLDQRLAGRTAWACGEQFSIPAPAP